MRSTAFFAAGVLKPRGRIGIREDFKSVDEYIASQPEAAGRTLGRVRSTIRTAVPGAQEVIS
jgi:hypothetical protein